MSTVQALPENPLRVAMRAGEPVFGMSVRLSRSPDIARVARASGHHFLFIDAQHAVFNPETIATLCHAAATVGVVALVRVRSVDDPDVALLLDNGAGGIVFPDVNTPAEAQRAVDRCLFPPKGRRSVAGGYPHFDFRGVPVPQASAALNAATLVCCMVETAQGLDNLEAIAAVPGVDVVHIGANDLLTSLGKPGQFDDPVVVEAMDRAIAATGRHGGFAGCGGNRDVARQAASVKRGVRFVTTQADTAFLAAAAGQWTAGLRKALEA
ncbi:MAG TPA: aldolase/citrate lyase family protein [Falsiroseomonas sp.]|jgi:2-keto-3-deoxy-L-rhamnonate aldolase RhmA|nr:aldolase/citrate lyase family protein [Falsiroseomonas sp.]